jgi:hypothetical protein
MSRRDALLALPGPSTTSLLLNIPHIHQTQNQPVVLIDRHDYDKIRSRAIFEENSKYHYLTLAYESLARRGIIDFIDYSRFYPPRLRERNLERNEKLLQHLSSDISRRYATVACELWTDYARGEYQEDFRGGLSEDVDEFVSMRHSERQQERKIASGVGDSDGWLRKVINKDVAALHIRRNADRELDRYNLKGIIAGGEHLITSQLSGTTPSELSDYDLPISEAGNGSNHLDRLHAGSHVHGLMPSDLTETRATLDLASELASEIAGVNESDWFVLGPALAVPSYDDLLDMNSIRHQFGERDLADLQQQAANLVKELRSKAEVPTSLNKLQYSAEYTAEQQRSKVSMDGFSVSSLTASLEHAVQVSAASNQIRSLTEEGGYDEAAVFVALSFINDPVHRYEQEAVYRKATKLKRRLNPPNLDQNTLESYRKERQGETWSENKDWHEDPEANR